MSKLKRGKLELNFLEQHLFNLEKAEEAIKNQRHEWPKSTDAVSKL